MCLCLRGCGTHRVLVRLRLAERGCRLGATSACIEDHRVVACVDDLDSVVVVGILQLATHALAAVGCRLWSEGIATLTAGAARGHVSRRSASEEDARRLQQALAGEGQHGRRRRRGRRSERGEVQKEVAVERTAAGVEDGALDFVRALESADSSVVQSVGVACMCKEAKGVAAAKKQSAKM